MQIGKMLFPVTSLGPGRRVGIWTTGCFRDCPGCINPDLQMSDPTKNMSIDEIAEQISRFDYDGVTISGGEPFMQTEDLASLIRRITERGVHDILVYSGYTLDELEKRCDKDTEYILANISVLVDGPFIKDLQCDNRLKGSSNQNIWILKEKYGNTYKKYLEDKKTIDVFYVNNEIHFIGIPSRNYQEEYRIRLQER